MAQTAVVVVGAGGQLGRELLLSGSPKMDCIGLARQELDITDPLALDACLARHAPAVVLNVAAYTAVDAAEADPAAAMRANAEAPGRLASACRDRGIHLVHVSTDFVFDGQSAAPYRPDAPVAPLGAPRGAWRHDSLLPGGDLRAWIGPAQRPDTDFARFEQALALRFAQLPPALCHRLARAYGALVERWLLPDQLGAGVAPGLFEAELHYLHQHEWARTAEDALWRRRKLGLHLSVGERDRVATWCTNHWPEGGSPLPAGPVPAMESAWN